MQRFGKRCDLLAKVVVDRLMSLTMSDARRQLLPLPIPDALVEQMQPPSQDEVKSTTKTGSDKSPSSVGARGQEYRSHNPGRHPHARLTPATKPSLGPFPPPGQVTGPGGATAERSRTC